MTHVIQRIAIDNQKVVEAATFIGHDADDAADLHTVIPFTGAHDVLTAWKDLDPGHRDFRYGGDADSREPCTVIIAWVDSTGALQMTDVDPFWDGSDELNAYSLDVLSGNIGCPLEWEPVTP